MKLRAAADRYIGYISIHMAPTSLKAYKSRLRFLTDSLGDRSLDSVSRRDVEGVAAAYRANRSGVTTRLFVVVIKGFFGYCVEEGYLTSSPASRLRKPSAPRRVPRALSDIAVLQLESKLVFVPTEDWSDRRNAAILITILNTGLRRAEVVGLRWSDVDLDSNRLVVRGKGGRERIVPMNERCRESLLPIQRNRKGHVFGHEDGHAIQANSLDVLLKRWLVRHKLPSFTLHQLRHTFATRLLARGVSLYDIRDLLGHDSVTTTEIYLSANPDRLRGAVDRL